MSYFLEHAAAHMSRRSLILGTASALAAGVAGPAVPPASGEARSPHSAPLPAPKPVPGGTNLPPLVHAFLPGPETITLPFSGLVLQGLNVEPSTITDFQGATAVAIIAGTATGSDGVTYNLESTVEVPRGAFKVNRHQRHASLHLRDLPLIESFRIFGPSDTPAVLDIAIEWDALADPADRGSGAAVPPTDPAAFLGRFAPAKARGRFSGRELGFSFRSNRGADSTLGYAEIGTERNGVFLQV